MPPYTSLIPRSRGGTDGVESYEAGETPSWERHDGCQRKCMIAIGTVVPIIFLACCVLLVIYANRRMNARRRRRAAEGKSTPAEQAFREGKKTESGAVMGMLKRALGGTWVKKAEKGEKGMGDGEKVVKDERDGEKVREKVRPEDQRESGVTMGIMSLAV
ncbi:MAG: hypothetical protein Q9176_005207 [Flavoplaca citrina]